MNDKIDFVIIWVDGNDTDWQKERAKYKSNFANDNNIHRFRDWDNLQYWFRGVEKFSPWVNNIYFVTWGHIPSWLNQDHPKLKIVKHEEFIPKEYLPTFSAHPIELNLHRIEGLSNNFVYFNDDMFLVDYVKEEMFFNENLPCDSAIMNVHCYNMDEMFILAPFRNIGVINKHFRMKEVLKKHRTKWFNVKYGINVLRNIYLLPCPRFPGLLQQHLPTSFTKEVFNILWREEYEILHETCKNKFRHMLDVNQWLMKAWQNMSGQFYPRKYNVGKSIAAHNIEIACNYISKQKGKMLCLNDVDMSEEKFVMSRDLIKKSFDTILPEKSQFEN
ncbi:stealth family protein [Paenibacillus sp. FSL L8-0696]|uniref:Glycosyl transferase n=1 Tax=Paenibacillus odorifer TaxID=189426 RepID=A0ABX3H9R6_9BACL|nr:stealth family protein [Paenibacillus odorifer]OMD46961.1 hypothetical protein BSK51_25805 [Paenibacillus odorifer]